jgi:hypothetical protein
VRFGRRGGEDFEVLMNAGDVLCFNGLVWHSGLANDSDSCVLFMYFDREAFYLSEEMRADSDADQSRFGFTKMYSEEQWVQYSATYTADQDTYIQLFSLRTWRCYQQASCAPLYQPLNSPLICKS